MEILATDIKARVKERYGAIAELRLENKAAAGCCGTSACCTTDGTDVAAALSLYSAEQVRDLPPEIVGATLGCGNPMAIASLQEGETVLDLGSGAGLDCFLSARQVGPAGHVIGLDMTDSMLALAWQNKAKVGLENVEFRKGEIEKMPIADASVDVIISNCVINLSPDKDAVFREAYRVLRPGGRFAVSDVVTRGEVQAEFRQALDLWAGCLSGALDELEYRQRLAAVGFTDVAIVDTAELSGSEIDEWAEGAASTHGNGCCSSDMTNALAEKIFSAKIWAFKPLN